MGLTKCGKNRICSRCEGADAGFETDFQFSYGFYVIQNVIDVIGI